jgi:hypothetical protein
MEVARRGRVDEKVSPRSETAQLHRLVDVSTGTNVEERQRGVGRVDRDDTGQLLQHGITAVAGDGRPLEHVGRVLGEVGEQWGVGAGKDARPGERVDAGHDTARPTRPPGLDQTGRPCVQP